MADFSGLSETLSADGKTLTLSGSATAPVSSPVTTTEVITAGDGTSETLHESGTVSVVKPTTAVYSSVTDSLGGVWTIAADGHSAVRS